MVSDNLFFFFFSKKSPMLLQPENPKYKFLLWEATTLANVQKLDKQQVLPNKELHLSIFGSTVWCLANSTNYTEHNSEGNLLNSAHAPDAVDCGSPVDTQAPHLIGFYDRVGRIEPPIADEGEKEEGGLVE